MPSRLAQKLAKINTDPQLLLSLKLMFLYQTICNICGFKKSVHRIRHSYLMRVECKTKLYINTKKKKKKSNLIIFRFKKTPNHLLLHHGQEISVTDGKKACTCSVYKHSLLVTTEVSNSGEFPVWKVSGMNRPEGKKIKILNCPRKTVIT